MRLLWYKKGSNSMYKRKLDSIHWLYDSPLDEIPEKVFILAFCYNYNNKSYFGTISVFSISI